MLILLRETSREISLIVTNVGKTTRFPRYAVYFVILASLEPRLNVTVSNDLQ